MDRKAWIFGATVAIVAVAVVIIVLAMQLNAGPSLDQSRLPADAPAETSETPAAPVQP